MSSDKKSRTIKVDYLARVEGEGALYIKIKGARVEDVRLKIFEPPRFFEAFLRGRHYSEAPDIAANEFDRNVIEEHVAYSNALHATLKDRGAYMAGPIARYNLNFDKLSPLAREAAREAGLSSECRNPFRSIIVRSVEVLYACDEALRIVDEYEPPDQAAVEIVPRAGVGYGCTEAPRGLLYHRYRIDEQGLIADAKIVPPTSQNQKRIETDLRQNIGSDAMVNLAQAWAEEYAMVEPAVSVEVSGGGAGTGVAALINGTLDLHGSKDVVELAEAFGARRFPSRRHTAGGAPRSAIP